MITDIVLIIQGTLIGSEISGEVDPDSARMLVIVTLLSRQFPFSRKMQPFEKITSLISLMGKDIKKYPSILMT